MLQEERQRNLPDWIRVQVGKYAKNVYRNKYNRVFNRRGECVRESECSLNNLDGYCRRRNEMCRDGRCERVTERDRCSEDNYRGFCPHNQVQKWFEN